MSTCEAPKLNPEEMSVGWISLDSELGDVVKIYGEPLP